MNENAKNVLISMQSSMFGLAEVIEKLVNASEFTADEVPAEFPRALHQSVVKFEERLQSQSLVTREEMRDMLQDFFEASHDDGHKCAAEQSSDNAAQADPAFLKQNWEGVGGKASAQDEMVQYGTRGPLRGSTEAEAQRLPSECIHGIHLSVFCHGCNGSSKVAETFRSTAGVDRSSLN